MRKPFLAAIALLGWLIIGLQTLLTVRIVIQAGRSMADGVVTTFSYFTVLTNLLVAVVATACLLRRRSDNILTRPGILTAAAVYIAVVGLVYSLVLRALWQPAGLQRVLDMAEHDAMPVLFVTYWLAFVPKGGLRWKEPAAWLIYPVLYGAWALLRGALTGRYPYPFLDVRALGYSRTLANLAMLVALFLAVGLIFVALDRAIGRARRRAG
ncbi:MAG TPA: Pr6Pr family membrane protein [Acetobacteraceae bacterium]|nr:Pr6Pr family membrane protein [Acetobacteraceae bacterium]